MKTLILSLVVLSLTATAFASESRVYSKTSPTEATVVITVDGDDADLQAASYVDGKESQQFIDDLLADKTSELAKIKAAFELEYCEQESTPEDAWIPSCGQIQFTEPVRTGFGRGGWASAGATYTIFMGFINDGTGHYFDVSHMITFSEVAESQTNDEGDFSNVINKTFTFGKITKLETEEEGM